MIITNNDRVYNELKDEHQIYYKNCSFKEILLDVRDRVHQGYELMTHPLSSSIKPNETPYKSIIMSNSKGNLDYHSLSIIENALLTYDKFAKNADYTVDLTDRIHEDFKLVDLTIIKSALH